jgi:hypothetical protein
MFPRHGRRRLREEAQPVLYYTDIAGSPSRCHRLVGFAQLASDLRRGRLPGYAWLSPNLCDDGHDCGVAGSERFLARTVPALLRELGPSGFLLITWDEGGSDAGCCRVAHGGHIATILAGAHVIPGGRDAQPLDHYGVLATIEEAFGLPLLAGAADPRAGRLTSLFAQPPRICCTTPRHHLGPLLRNENPSTDSEASSGYTPCDSHGYLRRHAPDALRCAAQPREAP